MEPGSEEWELSKENVQPIRQGRKVTNLTAALQPSGHGETQVNVVQQIQLFETEIRTYSGDDPFSVWYHYAKWTEQNFPKGGKDSNLPNLLERCVITFKDDKRYLNDHRYIDTWLKFINFCTDGISIFNFMHDQGIGWKCASFYEAYATELENLGNTKKADAVYLEGIHKNAEPKEKLLRLHREFQCRVARNAATESQEPSHEDTSQGQRTVLGGLKGRGKKVMKAPNVRVGSNVQVQPRGLGGVTVLNTEQSNAPIAVFDETAATQGGACAASMLPTATGEWNQLAPRNEAVKENTLNPGKWNTQRVQQRGGTIGIHEVAEHVQPQFTIHEDDNADQYVTPRKEPEMGHQALSARKPDKPINPLSHLTMKREESDKVFQPMYCKDMVYAGVREMSFEELRAVRHKEKATQRAMKAQQEMLRQQQEQLLQQQQQFQEEQRRLLEENRKFFEQQRQQIEADRLRLLEEQQKMITAENKTTSQPLQPTNHAMVPQESVRRKLATDSDTTHQDKQQPKPVTAQVNRISLPLLDKSSDKEQDFTVTGRLTFEDTTNTTGNLTNKVPQASLAYSTSASTLSSTQTSVNTMAPQPKTPTGMFGDANTSLKKTPVENPHEVSSGQPTSLGTPGHTLTAPSPTVHTKEALGVIEAMFNDSFHTDLENIVNKGAETAHKDDNLETFFAAGRSSSFHQSTSSAFAPIGGIGIAASKPFGQGAIGGAAPVNPFGQGAFEIYDETAADKKENEIVVYDENNTGIQENRAPTSFRPTRFGERRPLGGALQDSKDVAAMPCKKQTEPTVQEDNVAEYNHVQENDMIEGIEILNLHDKTAIASSEMSHSENKDFQRAARMASTPFNPSARPPSPPFSTIRQVDKTNNRRVNLGESLHIPMATTIQDISVDDGNARDVEKMETDEIRIGGQHKFTVFEEGENTDGSQAQRVFKDSTRVESFEETVIGGPPPTPLSPILEISNEDAQSTKSSAGSSGIASHLSVHQQSNISAPSSLHNIEDVAMASPQQPKPMMSNDNHQINQSHNQSTTQVFHETDTSQPMLDYQSAETKPAEQFTSDVHANNKSLLSVFQDEDVAMQSPQRMDTTAPQQSNLENQNLISESSFYQDPLTPRRLHDESMTVDMTPWNKSLQHLEDSSPTRQRCVEIFVQFLSCFMVMANSISQQLLSRTTEPLELYPGYIKMDSPLPKIQTHLHIDLDSDVVKVDKLIGKGAYAKIYRAEQLDANDITAFECSEKIIMKVQQPAWPWEFYITSQLHQRLRELNDPVDVSSAVIKIDKGYIYENGSVLTSKLHSSVTLLDIINLYKSKNASMPQAIALYYAVEILHIVEKVHRCGIIHADIKPDNVIVKHLDKDIDITKPMSEVEGLLLIDFGQAIDMKLFPEGTTFTASSNTSGFMCHEMQQGKPWTFQTDYYGIAASIYCLIFGDYMKTKQNGDKWGIQRKVARWYNAKLWDEFFTTLLNIPNCREMPSLSDLRMKMESVLQSIGNSEFQKVKKKQEIMQFDATSK
ncbi:uncharacterized protein LOC144440632 [Glandiceps talaboti]